VSRIVNRRPDPELATLGSCSLMLSAFGSLKQTRSPRLTDRSSRPIVFSVQCQIGELLAGTSTSKC
jgi:hypothetical protein